MTETVFVDTNVLVHARDSTEAAKNARALEWLGVLWSTRAGRLSWQVLQEYYVTVTRKLDPPRDLSDAREDVSSLVAWRPIPLDLPTVDAACAVEDRFGLSWWDSLIVATAQQGRCGYLLTEDLQDGQTFAGLTVLDPFRHDPADMGF